MNFGQGLSHLICAPIWDFAGTLVIINLSIGLYHPPIGTTLFITSTIARVRIGDVVMELIPFYFVAIGLLLAFAYLPWLTLH